jgi:recombinational DNA repair ATPase RecF
LVDDVDAELDQEALEKLLRFLGSDRQVLLSSTSDRVGNFVERPLQNITLEHGQWVNRETTRYG